MPVAPTAGSMGHGATGAAHARPTLRIPAASGAAATRPGRRSPTGIAAEGSRPPARHLRTTRTAPAARVSEATVEVETPAKAERLSQPVSPSGHATRADVSPPRNRACRTRSRASEQAVTAGRNTSNSTANTASGKKSDASSNVTAVRPRSLRTEPTTVTATAIAATYTTPDISSARDDDTSIGKENEGPAPMLRGLFHDSRPGPVKRAAHVFNPPKTLTISTSRGITCAEQSDANRTQHRQPQSSRSI